MGANRTKLVEYLSLSMNYRHEAKYDQLDIGGYYFNKLINIGLWYRGIPFKTYNSALGNSESVAILLGFEVPKQKIRIGYSYDITVSNLRINNTKGAHEVSLVYEFASKKRKEAKATTKVALPKF